MPATQSCYLDTTSGLDSIPLVMKLSGNMKEGAAPDSPYWRKQKYRHRKYISVLQLHQMIDIMAHCDVPVRNVSRRIVTNCPG